MKTVSKNNGSKWLKSHHNRCRSKLTQKLIELNAQLLNLTRGISRLFKLKLIKKIKHEMSVILSRIASVNSLDNRLEA